MKRILSVFVVALLALSLAACAAPAAPAEETGAPVSEATASPAATPEPTAEPTPSPTPEPVFTDISLSQDLFSRNKVMASVTGIRFSANYEAIVNLSITNNSTVPVTIALVPVMEAPSTGDVIVMPIFAFVLNVPSADTAAAPLAALDETRK